MCLTAYNFVNFLQLNNYAVFRSAINYAEKQAIELLFAAGLSAAALITNIFIENEVFFIVGLLVFLAGFTAGIKARNKKRLKSAKTPLVYTKRVVRLYAFIFFFNTAVFYGAYFFYGIAAYSVFVYVVFAFYAADYCLACSIINIFESLNNRRYIKKAAKKLDSYKSLIRIGITGSYGKTSVKNILKEMLGKKFNVVATEKNYNTPLGIVRTLDKIDGDTEIFIAEMGAKRRGEIAELCDMVKPDIGIITGITAQHMETFKSLGNVAATKSELYYAVKDGACIFNTDDCHIRELDIINRPNAIKSGSAEGLDCIAENIKTDADGSAFTLRFNIKKLYRGGAAERSREVHIKTHLIGRANVTNITTAAAAAFFLGISAEDIKAAAEALEPVHNRAEIIKNGGITVIDDTYNSNPVGAKAALETLSMFDGRRIVVACGFAEQSKYLAEANGKFGRDIARIADMAVLVGSGAKHIADGMEKEGFDMKKVYSYASLNQAKVDFSKLFMNGDVILFENDMPDNLE
jgi:UDP-N-acetylmuramoyl-tripeptide--D-alanyl-D-alanine ligase